MPEVALGEFDSGSFEPFGSGIYELMLTDWDVRQTSDGSKHPGEDYVNGEFTIQSGEFEGRKLWCNFMLPPYNPFMLKQLVAAVGDDPDGNLNTDEFFDRIQGEVLVNARVKKVAATGEYEAKNEIKGFKPHDPSKLTGSSGSDSSTSFAP